MRIDVFIVFLFFFRIEDFSEALSFVGVMFDFANNEGISGLSFLSSENVVILILAAIMSAPFLAKLTTGNSSNSFLFFKNIGLILMLLYAVMAMNFGSYNPFIYFIF